MELRPFEIASIPSFKYLAVFRENEQKFLKMRILFCQYWPFVSIVVGLLGKLNRFAGGFGHFWAFLGVFGIFGKLCKRSQTAKMTKSRQNG